MLKDKIFHPRNLNRDACCTFYRFKKLVPLRVFGFKRFTARVFMVPFKVRNHKIVLSDNQLIVNFVSVTLGINNSSIKDCIFSKCLVLVFGTP